MLAAMLIFLGLIGWGMYSIARSIFDTGADSSTPAVQSENVYEVTSAGTARFSIEGPVVANEDQRSLTISISENVVQMKVYAEYGTKVIAEKSYTNTSDSFDAFLSALDNANVTSRKKNTNTDTDYADQGVCATGKRYIVEFDQDVRRWSTTCSSTHGTAGIKLSSIKRLFEKQVPDYRDLIRGTGL